MIDTAFATELLATFGSPLYVYDLDEVECRAAALWSILPPDSALFYSFKANPLPGIAWVLRGQGCRAEVSSPGELRAAVAAGFASDAILYSGPGKTLAELREALQAGITYFSVESWHDLDRLATAAEQRQISVLLRVNPAQPPKAQLAMTGVASQFGFEEADLIEGAARLRDYSTIAITGLHMYYGSQVADAHGLLAAIQSALHTAEHLAERLDLTFQVVNVGGGFPWPYAVAEPAPDLSELRAGLIDLARRRNRTRSAQLWFESGRYLSAASGTLLTTVLAVKEAKGGKKFVILDAGINHLGGMAGLGRILRPFVSAYPLHAAPSAECETVDLVGPLCSPLDYLARNIQLPPVAPGDTIVIPNVGAYGLTASLIHFLSRPAPVEVTYRGTRYIDVYRLRTGHERIV